jgi:hypothetical protein
MKPRNNRKELLSLGGWHGRTFSRWLMFCETRYGPYKDFMYDVRRELRAGRRVVFRGGERGLIAYLDGRGACDGAIKAGVGLYRKWKKETSRGN